MGQIETDTRQAQAVSHLWWIRFYLLLILVALIAGIVEISSAITNGYSFFMGG